MPEDKIIISFEEEKPEKKEEKIILELGDEKPKTIDKEIKPQIKREDLKINSFFKEDSSLSSFSNSEIEFPSGENRRFSIKYALDLNDVFLNSILENNICAILSSLSGNIYIIKKDSGELLMKRFLNGESFEKTGAVFQNTIYINSLKTINKIEIKDTPFEIDIKNIYTAEEDYIIWSNLNYFEGKIAFIEYSVNQKSAIIKILNIQNFETVFEYKTDVTYHISDFICIQNNLMFILFDNKLIECNLLKFEIKSIQIDFFVSPETLMIGYKEKLFINNNDELLFIDLKTNRENLIYSGMSFVIISSIAGFGNNLFIGTANGWEAYKSNGMLLYDFEDISACKVESLNKNILAVSKQNRIVFHNLNKFQEAEIFNIGSENNNTENDSISSVKISSDSIFVLTYNGILKSFTNDKIDLKL